MNANVYSINGQKIGEVELPMHFSEEVREDLIRRVFIALESHKKQTQGRDELAGKKKVVWLTKERRRYKSVYGAGRSRTPRKTLMRRGMQFHLVGAFAPHTVGGREAHPPRTEKVIFKKINKKERKKAIRSAIAASGKKELVLSRGHKVNDVPEIPLIIEDKIENLKKTKDLIKVLKNFRLEKELERTEEKKIKAGKGKFRGRRYKEKKGILFVVSKYCDLYKIARNIPGCDAVILKDLNVEQLAPGGKPGRFVIWTKSAIEELKNKFL
ncbi:MAG: 50S ribosomal protein L4 [Candidatus Parvarchaeota archaeon]|nr:50S ribosomal protein L4 [Candidatus Jingweiarchaeum tengchongense]MCW1297804.1 50S ribosomal protein L4 [Candidatus Jingweiarchaeum tengchongense]MCW1299814.1 50S ribosomal protein L4 [Candidatus Jingweiarchaeum tengchongense]MCW1304215.1 50S ribosomal protein L4 [Candidatus Jingweiarchaeum tengchongense]MCW1305243.1 50S ribosomal protein L4 [Candidatus Jingweiarchaeum tengchongense]